MADRLRVPEGQTYEAAQRRFDGILRTSAWALPGGTVDGSTVAAADEPSPWWWEGEEEASQSFLAAMGVDLNG